MKEKEMIYLSIQRVLLGVLEEERLYMLRGKTVTEYINGNFQKINRKSLEIFAQNATFVAVFSTKTEYNIKKIGKSYSLSYEDKRVEYNYGFNLKNIEHQKKFLKFIG